MFLLSQNYKSVDIFRCYDQNTILKGHILIDKKQACVEVNLIKDLFVIYTLFSVLCGNAKKQTR